MSYDYKNYIDLRDKPIRIVVDNVDFFADKILHCEGYEGFEVTDFGATDYEERKGWHCIGIRVNGDWQCAIITHALLEIEEKSNEPA